MSTRFLGKPIPHPNHTPQATSQRRLRRVWLGIAASALGVVGLASFSVTVNPQPAQPTLDSISSIFSSIPASLVANAGGTTSGTTSGFTDNYNPDACSVKNIPDLNTPSKNVFPLIPAELDSPNGCNPTNWNLTVGWYFGYKLLYILNWFAGVVAVCLTVYAGLLYISGFASEANVKKAKTLLIICYTGLIIVFTARIILLGFAGILNGNPSNNNIFVPLEVSAPK